MKPVHIVEVKWRHKWKQTPLKASQYGVVTVITRCSQIIAHVWRSIHYENYIKRNQSCLFLNWSWCYYCTSAIIHKDGRMPIARALPTITEIINFGMSISRTTPPPSFSSSAATFGSVCIGFEGHETKLLNDRSSPTKVPAVKGNMLSAAQLGVDLTTYSSLLRKFLSHLCLEFIWTRVDAYNQGRYLFADFAARINTLKAHLRSH